MKSVNQMSEKRNCSDPLRELLSFCFIGAVVVHSAKIGKDETEASVVHEDFNLNPQDGSYKYAVETNDGIKIQESGRQISIGKEFGASASRSYAYIAPDLTEVTLTYIADENGFQPKGDHLPVPPEVPDYVVKLLSDLTKSRKA
ncbi:cuticle protein CP14.6-like [Artemia franciscana]|uniref:cuticle protein CP14.6-like n=1 Tax=Artemia franciscana TaxID=6661 RepID=UPI0032DADCE4